MLLFSQAFEGRYVNGSFIMWLSFGVLAIVAVALTEEKQVELLLTPHQKISNSKKLLEQLRFMVKLWSWMQADENVASLIDGFLELIWPHVK